MNELYGGEVKSFNYFEIDGTLDADELVKLQTTITYQMKFGRKYFLFDLSKLTYITGEFLRTFIKTQKQLMLVDGFLVILSSNSKIIEIIEKGDLVLFLKLKNTFSESISEFII